MGSPALATTGIGGPAPAGAREPTVRAPRRGRSPSLLRTWKGGPPPLSGLAPLYASSEERRRVRASPYSSSCAGERGGGIGRGEKGWIHFVGIGGCGLSALAMLALEQGFEVSGSDMVWSFFMDQLHKAGARLYIGHSIANMQRNNSSSIPVAVVISSAIPTDNVEVSHAKSVGIPVYKRDLWLRKITEHSTLVAVSGTHGKSTTSGMLSYVLHAMGKDITAVIGAYVPQLPKGNVISGSGPMFVLEADEYDGCFLGLSPYVAVITNLEWEHVDFFENEEAVKNMYKRFLQQIREGGHVILCGDCAGAGALLGNSTQRASSDRIVSPSLESATLRFNVVTYGTSSSNDWSASAIIPNTHGGQDYTLYHRGSPVSEISIRLPGVHNVLNSLAVIATITVLANDDKQLHDTINRVNYHLNKFEGISRRFEMVGKVQQCYIYDDYAHHPSEICVVLQAARQRFPRKELIVVFQPHTFSRVAALMESFAAAFGDADRVIVTEIYAARERNALNVSGRDLATMIKGPSSEYIPKLNDVLEKLIVDLSSKTNAETVVLTLGAGDITNLGPKLISRLRCISEAS